MKILLLGVNISVSLKQTASVVMENYSDDISYSIADNIGFEPSECVTVDHHEYDDTQQMSEITMNQTFPSEASFSAQHMRQ